MDAIVSGVGVLDKCVAILDTIERGPATIAEIVEKTALPRATTYRMTAALELHGFVTRDGDGRFRLGPRLTGPTLAAVAHPWLEKLRDATGESVQLFVRRGSRRACVVSLESPHGLRTIVPVGAVLPMNVGSAAKALAGKTKTARQGWVESVEEREKGVASVSAPVHQEGSVVAAISVSGPIDRTTRAPGRRYGRAVVSAARGVEAALSRRS